jgi:hypothetical protein
MTEACSQGSAPRYHSLELKLKRRTGVVLLGAISHFDKIIGDSSESSNTVNVTKPCRQTAENPSYCIAPIKDV